MNTRNEANPSVAVFLENLKIQLRLREVPGDRIGQILAEVETHVADTGLAFYRVSEAKAARDTARAVKPRRLLSLYVVLVSLAYLGAVAGLVWVPELLPTGPTLVSIPGLLLLVGGLLAGFALWRHTRVSRVVDPRG